MTALAICLLLQTQSLFLESANGGRIAPLLTNQSHATVVIFIAHDCPISNTYAKEIERIFEWARPKGVRFFGAFVDSGLKPAAAMAHGREYGLKFPLLLDSERALAKRLGATVTPQAFVLARNGAVLYCGRIDNLYADIGKKRPRATTHELRDAIGAAVQGKKPQVTKTAAIGCVIAP